MNIFNSTKSVKFGPGIFSVLFFLGALFWAKEQDPFSRKWFTIKSTNGDLVKCVAVLPKPIRKYSVIIYAHGSDGSLMNDGNVLRQMAELGLATVSLEYTKTNVAIFSSQFEALRHYLMQQTWVNTNAIVWVGLSMGGNRMLDFALKYPAQQPQLLVQISRAEIQEEQTDSKLDLVHCPVLLFDGEQDQTPQVSDTIRMALVVRSNGVPTEIKVFPNMPRAFEPEYGVIFRAVGEYCLLHLTGKDCWQNYRSITQLQAEAPPLCLFWLPAVAWIVGWFAWCLNRKATSTKKYKLKRHEIELRLLAALLATWAIVETTIHLVVPQFSVNDKTLSIARRILIQSKEHDDFEYLAVQSIWHTQKLKTLLEHVELAGYNREIINWQLDDEIYRDFVLSPVITARSGDQINWRRSLWEEFYPRIRHESSPEDAAKIVVRHLRERITITASPNLPHDVPDIWLKQVTDETGFEIIYVAALRSVGVPARLNNQGQAVLFADGEWQPAPRPAISSFS